VLDDETRVLSQRGVIGGLGMSSGSSGHAVRGGLIQKLELDKEILADQDEIKVEDL
jgi:hypothetical protein